MTNLDDVNKTHSSIWTLFPFFVFIIFYFGLSVWQNDFYSVPMPIAFLIASATALVMRVRNDRLNERVEIFAKGMGDVNIMQMCLIFVLAGSFAAIAKAMGAVDAAVMLSRCLIPSNLFLVGFFLIACFISLALGTSCGTIAALVPIAIGIAGELMIAPELMIGAVVGGAMFGDNLSMISDTTIAVTRTMNVRMKDKFLTNIRMVIPASVITLILYCFCGAGTGQIGGEIQVDFYTIMKILPYLFILIGGICGLNVIVLLFMGSVLAALLGIGLNSFSFLQSIKLAGTGALNMSETMLVAMLAGGLLGVIRHHGGIDYIMKKINSLVHSKRGCEIGVAMLIGFVNVFTANNTVAIVIAGPIAREISENYQCDRRRIASILDTMSCVVQGMIPYGAQILIALGLAAEAGLVLTSFSLIKVLYYPMLLGFTVLLSLVIWPSFFGNKKQREAGV